MDGSGSLEIRTAPKRRVSVVPRPIRGQGLASRMCLESRAARPRTYFGLRKSCRVSDRSYSGLLAPERSSRPKSKRGSQYKEYRRGCIKRMTDTPQPQATARQYRIDRTGQRPGSPQHDAADEQESRSGTEHHNLVFAQPDELRYGRDQSDHRRPCSDRNQHGRQDAAYQCRRAGQKGSEGEPDISGVRIAHRDFLPSRARMSASGVAVRSMALTS